MQNQSTVLGVRKAVPGGGGGGGWGWLRLQGAPSGFGGSARVSFLTLGADYTGVFTCKLCTFLYVHSNFTQKCVHYQYCT